MTTKTTTRATTRATTKGGGNMTENRRSLDGQTKTARPTVKATVKQDGFASLLGSSHKIELSNGYGVAWFSEAMYLAPASSIIDGVSREVCAFRSPECSELCLSTSGRGGMSTVQTIRLARTKLFWRDRPRFLELLRRDIRSLIRRAHRQGKQAACRLNATSDIPWELIGGILEEFPQVTLYDYTKSYKRMIKFLEGRMPSNYHLTFSRSEVNDDQVADVLARGGNVAAVFSTKMGDALPESYRGRRVIDGRAHDMRFLDPQGGNWVGLSPIGKAKKGSWGFILEV